MAALIPSSPPPADHTIKVEIVSKLDEVKIDELELGDEYPSLYRVLELFPSLAGNAIRQRLSLKTQMTCNTKRNTGSEALGVQFNNCLLSHDKTGALWNAAAKRLAALCSAASEPTLSKTNACNFLFSSAAGNTLAGAPFRRIPQGQCLWQGDKQLSPSTAGAADDAKVRTLAERRRENLSNHLATRPLYILGRADELRVAKSFKGESLHNKGEPSQDEVSAGQLWSEFLFGGSLPTHGSDGSAYKIKVSLLSQPQIRSVGLDDVVCGVRDGQSNIEFSQIALRIDFSKNKFRLKGDFMFSQKLSSTVSSDFSKTQAAHKN
jgi:hypothetical protein